MHDSRIDKLANLLLDHSCSLKSGEHILIEAFDLPEPNLVTALVEGAAEPRGGTTGQLEEQCHSAVPLSNGDRSEHEGCG